jgi:hypothetical protein
MIPSLVILKVAEDRHVLVSFSVVDEYVEAKVVDNSKYLFNVAEWRSDGLEGRPQDYNFKRISTRSEPKIYISTLSKTSNYVIVPWHEPIHIYKMKYSGVILPSAYFKVFKGEDAEERWHFKKPSAPSPSVPVSPPTFTKIPSHIVNAFIESAIQKKEACPITLDTLVMGNVAMTPCGHLFERQALVDSIHTNAICPNCRAPVKQEFLVLA